jgi:hypothetical protein
VPEFRNDFGPNCSVNISADTLAEIHAAIKGSSSIETAFEITGKLRNTTGHNLVWDDIFDVPKNYVDLFEQEMNAILYVVSQNLIEPNPATVPTGPLRTVPMKVIPGAVYTSTGGK